jgi:hypothetical protein
MRPEGAATPSEILSTTGSTAPSATPFAISSQKPLVFGVAVVAAASQICLRLLADVSRLGLTFGNFSGLPPSPSTASSPAMTPPRRRSLGLVESSVGPRLEEADAGLRVQTLRCQSGDDLRPVHCSTLLREDAAG